MPRVRNKEGPNWVSERWDQNLKKYILDRKVGKIKISDQCRDECLGLKDIIATIIRVPLSAHVRKWYASITAIAVNSVIICHHTICSFHRPDAILIHDKPAIVVIIFLVLRQVIEEALPQQVDSVDSTSLGSRETSNQDEIGLSMGMNVDMWT